MKIFLRDLNPSVVLEWVKAFEGVPDIHWSRGDIFGDGEHMAANAIISPANSFAYMDGGIDQVYKDHFGADIEDRLRHFVNLTYNGELPIGCALSVETRINSMPWMISAPTMRVPATDVSGTVNAYLAFRASLIEAEKRGYKSILCPGLCTAAGMMPPARSAVQMRQAYDDLYHPRIHRSWRELHKKEQEMRAA